MKMFSPEFQTRPHMTQLSDTGELSWCDVPHARPYAAELVVQRENVAGAIEHVANTEYVRWLDRAAELHADSLGYTRKWLFDQQMMWFVARHEVDYLAEAWLGERLIIATWAREFGKVKSWRDYLIVRPSDRTIICRASTLWVLVDLASRRPKRISAEMVSRFDPLTSSPAPVHIATSSQI